MRKIFFLIGLSMALTCLGQNSLTLGTLPEAQVDSIGGDVAQASFNSSISGDVTKAVGDSAYIKGNYGEAIRIYESLLTTGEAAEIYYNLGNSYYKAGEIAKAVLNYERALLLHPGDADIRANLDVARSKTIDKVESTPEVFFISWTKSLINRMAVDVWGTWGITFFILFLIALYFFFFSKQIKLKKISFFSGILFLLISLCANLFAFQQKHTLLHRDKAIIMLPSITVRSTPSESGTSLFILHEGRKVSIKDNSMQEWKEIRLEDGKVGWVPASAIEII